MRFDRRIASITAILVSLSGCSWSQDHPKPLLSLQQGALDLSCLQKASPDLHELFQGNLTDSKNDRERAAGIWTCLDRALEVFSTHTVGSEKGAYQAEELQRFANHFMKADQQIDDAFRDSIFRLKTAVLGGSTDRITKEEVTHLRKNLLRFGEAISSLAPQLRVLLQPESYDLKTREVALAEMTRFTSSVAGIFEESKNPILWNELAEFSNDLERYIKADKTTALTLIHEQKDLLRHIKVLLVGGADDQIESSKWKPILDGFSSTFGALLLSQNSSDIIEKIRFKFLSTPREQVKAIQSLGKELKRLKKNSNLKTKNLISRIADYYIKGRLLLEIALPEGKTPLSINLLFNDRDLRNSESRFLRSLFPTSQPGTSNTNPSSWINQIRELLRQLDRALYQKTGRSSSFSLSRLEKLASQHQELFADPRLANQILAGIPLFLTFHSILNHKTDDEVLIKDLDPILEKAGQFLEHPFQRDLPLKENYDRIVRVLKQKPEIQTIMKISLKGVLPHLSPMLSDIFKIELSPEHLSELLDMIFQSKKLLWGTAETAINHEDFDEIGFLIEKAEEMKESPLRALEILRSRWEKPGHEPAVSLDHLERIAEHPITQIESFKKLQLLGKHATSVRILRRFLLGSDTPVLRLCEITEMLLYATRIEAAARSGKPNQLSDIIDELLLSPEALRINQTEIFQIIASIEQLRPGSIGRIAYAIPKIMLLKHKWFGTPEDALIREDFVLIRQLLLLKDQGVQALVGFFDQLSRNGTLTDSTLDLQELRELFVSLQDSDPEGSKSSTPETSLAVTLLDEAIQLKKTLFADSSPIIRSNDIKRWIDQWLAAQKRPALVQAKTLLDLLLENISAQELKKETLSELIVRTSAVLEKMGAKPLKVTKLNAELEMILNLKSVLLGTPSVTITRQELETLNSALGIQISKKTPAQKAAAYAKLLKLLITRPIALSDLARTLGPVVAELGLTKDLPIRINLPNLKRLKQLTVGGSPNQITPSELISLVQKSASARSASDWISTPSFKIDAVSFEWVENALALAIESKKTLSLKEAYENFEETFKKSGKSLKLPMEKSLYGFWYHVLEGKKGLLPSQSAGTFHLDDTNLIQSSHLRLIADKVHSILTRLKDLEQAYGTSRDALLSRAALLQKLKHPENLRIVKNYVPTLRKIGGSVSLRLEENVEAGGEFIIEELAYKIVLSETIEFLFRRYNMRNDKPSLNTLEFSLLLEDLRVPMINFGLLYKSGPSTEVAKKQMQTINLMTRTGNGDSWLDLDETVEFMSLGFGTADSFQRLIRHLTAKCWSRDVAGIPGFEGKCVIRNLFNAADFKSIYGDSIPGTVQMYSTLEGSKKTNFDIATLRLTGKNLLQEKPRSLFDAFSDRTLDDYSYVDFDYDMLQSINSVHPLLEGVFQMMDSNNSQRISLAEALAYFPRFCPAIQEASKGKIEGDCKTEQSAKELKKLYGYLLVHKEKPGIGFYFWDSNWSKIQTGKTPFQLLTRYDLIAILSNLSP